MTAAARLVLAGLIIMLLVGAYYPFAWDPPRIVRNDVARDPDGSLRFGPVNQARTAGVPSWLGSARRSGAVDLQLDVKPASLRQGTPASMMMLASDYWHTDFAVEQYRSDLYVWLRRPGSDINGDPPFVVGGVFRPSTWTNVAVLIGHRVVRILVDGQPRLVRRIPPDTPRVWGTGLVALANEVHGGGPWLGSIRRAEVRAGGRSIDYVRPGALAIPRTYLYFPDHLEPASPLQGGELLKGVAQLAAFTAVGLLIVLARRRSARPVAAGLLGTTLAVALGAGRLLFHGRHVAITDIVSEAAGAWIGAWLMSVWVRRHRAQVSRPVGKGPDGMGGG